jgi:hypothetical protein
VTPFYDDEQVTLYCADCRAVDVEPESTAAVVTSPPYNVGLGYDEAGDALDWPAYWSLAADVADLLAVALVPGGRAWVNTAVAVPGEPECGWFGEVADHARLPVGYGVGASGVRSGGPGGVVLGPGGGHGVGVVGVACGTEPAR